jgi:hypothetical protein
MENSTSPHAPSDGSEETFFWVLGILLFVLVVAVAPTFWYLPSFYRFETAAPKKEESRESQEAVLLQETPNLSELKDAQQVVV